MNKKTIGIVIIILCLIFIIFFLVSKRSQQEFRSTETNSLSQDESILMTEEDSLDSSDAVTPNKQGSPVKTSVSAIGVVESTCPQIEKEKVQKGGVNYKKGSLIVSFPASTSFTQAVSIMAQYDISLASDTEASETYAMSNWFMVTVPSGKEFDLKCAIMVDTRIKYVTINPIIELNQ